MKERILQIIEHLTLATKEYTEKHLMRLFIFNVFLIVLLLLHSAGYFAPYLPLTINFIMLISLIVASLLLRLNNVGLIIISLSFWVFACLLRLLGVNIWAERTAIYSYEALTLAVILIILPRRK